MNIDLENAQRLNELVGEIAERMDEFKQICRTAMSSNEYQQFKYRTLGHLEPGLLNDSEWITSYSAIDSLEKVAENALEEAEGDEDEEETED